MIAQFPEPCWVVDHGDAHGQDHYPDRGEAERDAAQQAAEDDERPNWPVRATEPCWTATCECGAPLITAWETADLDDDDPPEVVHRDRVGAIDADRVTGGRCAACWTTAVEAS